MRRAVRFRTKSIFTRIAANRELHFAAMGGSRYQTGSMIGSYWFAAGRGSLDGLSELSDLRSTGMPVPGLQGAGRRRSSSWKTRAGRTGGQLLFRRPGFL